MCPTCDLVVLYLVCVTSLALQFLHAANRCHDASQTNIYARESNFSQKSIDSKRDRTNISAARQVSDICQPYVYINACKAQRWT